MRTTAFIVPCLLTTALACADDITAFEPGTTTDPSTGDAEVGTEADADADTEPDTDTDTGEDATCGNGVVEPGELCDDGNAVDNDYCSNACTSACALQWHRGHDDLPVTGGYTTMGLVRDGAGNLVVGVRRPQGAVGEAWVAKFDPSGEGPLWTASLANPGGDSWVAALALGADDDVYATGSRLGVDGQDLFVARLGAEDGAELWAVEVDGALDASDDEGRALTATAGGVVVVGTMMEAEGDSDMWIAQLDFSGSTVWSQTHGGALAPNGFSLDEGAAIATAPDGSLRVAGRVYLDFDSTKVDVLELPPGGGAPTAVLSPHGDPGGRRWRATGLDVAADGALYVALVDDASPVGTFRIARYEPGEAQPTWALDNDDIAVDGDGSAWDLMRLRATADGPIVAGARVNAGYVEGPRQETWFVRLNADGVPTCYGGYGLEFDDGFSWPALPAGLVDEGPSVFVSGWSGSDAGFHLWLAEFG